MSRTRSRKFQLFAVSHRFGMVIFGCSVVELPQRYRFRVVLVDGVAVSGQVPRKWHENAAPRPENLASRRRGRNKLTSKRDRYIASYA